MKTVGGGGGGGWENNQGGALYDTSMIICKGGEENSQGLLCVLCSPCYSRWCYGQILAIAPLQSMFGRE